MLAPMTPFAGLAALLAAAALPAQWVLQPAPVAPSPRVAPAMAANTAGAVILFGGQTGSIQTPASAETWQFDGSVWQQLAPFGSPSGRSRAAFVLDSTRNVFVLHGGFANGSPLGNTETWEFDGVAWTLVAPPTLAPGVFGHAACFDSARSRVVVFGGVDGSSPVSSSATHEYDGTDWQLVNPTSNPGPRYGAAMCFAVNLGRAVLFGGLDGSGQIVATTWLYDGTTWQQAAIAGPSPPARVGAGIAYDPVRGVCVLVGGFGSTGPRNDTWEFDGSSWQQQPSTPLPAAELAGLAYDVGHQTLVRFGGFSGSQIHGETWRFGANTAVFGSGCAGSHGVPLLQATTLPTFGGTYHLQLTNLVPAVPLAVIVFALSAQPGVPLAPIGMPGCSAFVSPDLFVALAAFGTAQFATNVPPNPGLFAAELFAQGISLDAAANAAGLTVSNAVKAVIGH
jgi:hypothetical protein